LHLETTLRFLVFSLITTDNGIKIFHLKSIRFIRKFFSKFKNRIEKVLKMKGKYFLKISLIQENSLRGALQKALCFLFCLIKKIL